MTERRASKRARQERMLTELKATPALRVSELAHEFGVSTETIRRDLDSLSRDGLVSRTYGGAANAPAAQEPALNERHRAYVAERGRIARAAAGLVEPHDVLMVDSGSTTAHFARRLAADFTNITVVTNGLSVATALATTPSIRVVLCPGDYDGHEGGVFGPETLAFLDRFTAHRCFIGCSGLSAEGPGEASSGSAWVKRKMIERSGAVVLLADRSKFGQTSLETVCALDALDAIVSDTQPPTSLAKTIRVAGAELHIAK